MFILRINGSPLSVAFMLLSDALEASLALLPMGKWCRHDGGWTLVDGTSILARITHDSP